MEHVQMECMNILTQKQKAHASHYNLLFRAYLFWVTAIVFATVIHSHFYIGGASSGEGGWKLLTSRRDRESNPKILENFHVVFAATKLHPDTLFFQLFFIFKQF